MVCVITRPVNCISRMDEMGFYQAVDAKGEWIADTRMSPGYTVTIGWDNFCACRRLLLCFLLLCSFANASIAASFDRFQTDGPCP